MDNYYCNGVISADGHQWATQGAVTDYREKMAGDYTRGYDFGIDCLMLRQLQFHLGQRPAGRPVVPQLRRVRLSQHRASDANWFDIYHDFPTKAGKIAFRHSIAMETLKKYTCPDYPGWNLAIPDALRLDAFLKEFQRIREERRSGRTS